MEGPLWPNYLSIGPEQPKIRDILVALIQHSGSPYTTCLLNILNI